MEPFIGVAHECDGETDGQTDGTAVSKARSNDPR